MKQIRKGAFRQFRVCALTPYCAVALVTTQECRAQEGSDSRTIENAIAQLATVHRSTTGGNEVPDARQIIMDDLDGDGNNDAALLYTIEGMEGGNNWDQFLAIFLRRDGELVFTTQVRVGGKGRRSVKLSRILEESIVLDTKSYGETDPSCCPSIEGETTYRLQINLEEF